MANLQDNEIQKKKLFENMEELTLKNKKIKGLLEQEENQRINIEKEMQNLKAKTADLTKLFEETKNELQDKNTQIKTLSKEIENYDISLATETKKVKALQRDIEDSKNELNATDGQKNEIIGSLKDNIENLKREHKILQEKLSDMIKTEKDRYDNESNMHLETRSKLKHLESKLQNQQLDNENNEQQIDKLKRNIIDLETLNGENRLKIVKLENLVNMFQKDKNELLKKIEEGTIRNQQAMLNIETSIKGRLNDYKKELIELKEYSKNLLFSSTKEFTFKISNVMNISREIFRGKEIEFEKERNTIRYQLENDFNRRVDQMKEQYNNMQKDLISEYDQKFYDKEKRIELLQENFEKNTNKLNSVEREIDRNNLKLAQSEEDNAKSKIQISLLNQEKETMNGRFEALKLRYNQDINEVNKESYRFKEGSLIEKKEQEFKIKQEIEKVLQVVELLKERNLRNLQKFEGDIQKLNEFNIDEIQSIKQYYENKINLLNDQLYNYEKLERDFLAKISNLQDKLAKFERHTKDLEKEKFDMRQAYEKKLENFDVQMEQVNYNMHFEAERSKKFKSDRQEEIEKFNNHISTLEGELKHRNERILVLINDKTRLEKQIKELQGIIEAKSTLLDKQRQDIIDKTSIQTKEIEQLHHLLSKSYKSISDSVEVKVSKERQEGKENIEIEKAFNDFNKLNQYLDSGKSPTANYKTVFSRPNSSRKEKPF